MTSLSKSKHLAKQEIMPLAPKTRLSINTVDTRPFLEVQVGPFKYSNIENAPVTINFLLDSGAACSIIRRQNLLNIDLIQNKIFNQHQNVVTANGSQLNINFQLDLELNIGGTIKKHVFNIADNISHNIYYTTFRNTDLPL